MVVHVLFIFPYKVILAPRNENNCLESMRLFNSVLPISSLHLFCFPISYLHPIEMIDLGFAF